MNFDYEYFFNYREVEVNFQNIFEKYKIRSSRGGSSGKLSFKSSIDPNVIWNSKYTPQLFWSRQSTTGLLVLI